jgi:hypothetical protein
VGDGALLGRLGQPQKVWAECLFADPVGDIAVLGEPDSQDLYEQCRDYRTLMDEMPPLAVSKLRAHQELAVWVLPLKADWVSATARFVRIGNECPYLHLPNASILGGMSGSPILAEEGSAIGVISFSSDCGVNGVVHLLDTCLPGWLLRELGL